MDRQRRLELEFFRSNSGREPVRIWLDRLSDRERQQVAKQLKKVQFGWPLGMPLVRKIESHLWEARIPFSGQSRRVLFTVVEERIVLLHAFSKTSQKIPDRELQTARRRRDQILPGGSP